MEAVCRDAGYTGGLSVVIGVEGGREAARHTFNPQMGVEGGLSILGTSGIVEPMSEQAIVDTIALEIRQHAAHTQISFSRRETTARIFCTPRAGMPAVCRWLNVPIFWGKPWTVPPWKE